MYERRTWCKNWGHLFLTINHLEKNFIRSRNTLLPDAYSSGYRVWRVDSQAVWLRSIFSTVSLGVHEPPRKFRFDSKNTPEQKYLAYPRYSGPSFLRRFHFSFFSIFRSSCLKQVIIIFIFAYKRRNNDFCNLKTCIYYWRFGPLSFDLSRTTCNQKRGNWWPFR